MADPKPRIPAIRRAVNMVWRMLMDGCDAPLTVWLDEFWEPAGKLVLAWYTIDLMNILSTWLQPKGLPVKMRTARHGGNGRKHKRGSIRTLPGKAVSFDIGEFIGSNLWGAEELSHRPVPPGTMSLWTIFGAIERLNYFFMVLELGGDFIVNWCSAVVKLGYCGNRDDAVLLAVKPWAQQIGIFGWSAVVWDETLKNRKLTFWNGVGWNQLNGTSTMYVRMNAKCLEAVGGEGVCGLRFRCLDGPDRDREVTTVITLPQGAEAPMVLGHIGQAEQLWIVEIIVGGIWEFTDMEVYMQAAWTPYE